MGINSDFNNCCWLCIFFKSYLYSSRFSFSYPFYFCDDIVFSGCLFWDAIYGSRKYWIWAKNNWKKQSAEGLGTLLNEVELTEDVGTPLISYILDDQFKEPVRKALRVTNEDRGIVAGVPGAGKKQLI